MEASQRFFENRDCPFFPCHELEGDFNCLFCYCPLYFLPDCPGNYTMRKRGSGEIRVCTDCTYPHEPSHYDDIMNEIRKALDRGNS
ncbi:MAG: metal-binding protein [Lachnospiraceae bacterium]|nr:metal-binding protein [Lachnospiraceae bacterium]